VTEESRSLAALLMGLISTATYILLSMVEAWVAHTHVASGMVCADTGSVADKFEKWKTANSDAEGRQLAAAETVGMRSIQV